MSALKHSTGRSFFQTFIVLLVLFFATSLFAKELPYIPESLKPWVDWVLHDKHEQVHCTAHYNNAKNTHCSWPSELTLKLNSDGGEFVQSWIVEYDQWISLPGDRTRWPVAAQVNNENAIVVEKNGKPHIFLEKGEHLISGRFSWFELPENLLIPENTGIVSLFINNTKVVFPNRDNAGVLWLKRGAKEEKIEDKLKIESFRLVNDTIPARVELLVTLDIAGTNREISLGPLYQTDQFIPLSLRSQLPAKIEQNGLLRVQVRPGQYSITLTLRHLGPLEKLPMPSINSTPWPAEEIWVFQSQPDLRLVEIEGGTVVDPLQTSLPVKWQQLPAFRILQGEQLFFKQIKRGDPAPAPDQLSLQRNLWLRFDGSGYTIEDHITGKKNTNWRLESGPSIQLGRVEIDGREQFITKRENSDNTGVELRNGLVNLSADSLYVHDITSLPATGWEYDFDRVQTQLFLPPGWKLLHATGMDHISRTWVKRWTLLDLFIVLIFTIAIAKTISIPISIIGFTTMVLVYHEPHAPRFIWLGLLLGITMLRYLPESRLKNIVRGYQIVVILLLIGIIIPYSINALRIGVYPQLAKPWVSMARYEAQQQRRQIAGKQQNYSQQQQIEIDKTQGIVAGVSKKAGGRIKEVIEPMMSSVQYSSPSQVLQYDPKAFNQTGPGLPRWQPYGIISFGWSGPVSKDQNVSFIFLGPKINLALSFLRVGLVLLLAFAMAGISLTKKGKISWERLKSLRPLVVLFFLCCLSAPNNAQASGFPSHELLDQLEHRLLQDNTCFPNCATISSVDITISPQELIIVAEVDAHVQAAIPLPSDTQQWMPQSVLVNNSDANGMMRLGNNIWLIVAAGQHTVEMRGALRTQNTIQLPLPLKPHHMSVTADGWTIDGMHSDGSFDDQLQFKRIRSRDNEATAVLEPGTLPPFIRIERTLMLGLVWKVHTRVQRLSPLGNAIVLDIPLINGESVTTKGIRVENSVVKLNLRQKQNEITWESFLEPASKIQLQHAPTHEWTEVWQVDISPIFHLDYSGIPVIHHKVGNRWHPTWHPFPGEQVVLNITRPLGIEGQTMTIEKSHLVLSPGQRSTAATLQLEVKSSQGGQHTIQIQEDIQLQEVKVNGRVQPLRLENRNLTLPIIPGKQVFQLKWLENRGMAMQYESPKISLGVPSVNTSIDLKLPANRWPLFIGGEHLVGPAVLFWSVIIIIFLVAIGLSLTGWTPLRFHHWLLLGIGMSVSNLIAAFLVVGWLIALEYRNRMNHLDGRLFNLTQVGIVSLTVVGIGALVFAISHGLLGHPDMNIVGNGSSRSLLRWYHDVSEAMLPKAWVFSIPMLAYRAAMLLWALWVSFWLISILKWGWIQFSSPRLWSAKTAKESKDVPSDNELKEN